MGVELDDSSEGDWQNEKEIKFDTLKKTRRSSSITEHSPVSTRTMGENAQHISKIN